MMIIIHLLIAISFITNVLSEIYYNTSLNRTNFDISPLNIDDSFKILPIKVTYNLTYQTILTLSNPNENAIFSHHLLELPMLPIISQEDIVKILQQLLQSTYIDLTNMQILAASVDNEYQQYISEEKYKKKFISPSHSYEINAIDKGFTEYFLLHTNLINSTCSERLCNSSNVLITDIQINSHNTHNVLLSQSSSITNDQYQPIITLVSGFWPIAQNKYTPGKYIEWFQYSLNFTMPLILFTPKSQINQFLSIRKHHPTLYIPREYNDLLLSAIYPSDWIHEIHVPSQELAVIWLEKINLLYQGIQLTDTDYIAWYDAGLATYRTKSPPNKEWLTDIILSLPIDRISYCYVKDYYHEFGASVMIMHRSIVKLIHKLFYDEFSICYKHSHEQRTNNNWYCGSDQYIFTNITKKYPALFHRMCYDYGDIDFLYGESRHHMHRWYKK